MGPSFGFAPAPGAEHVARHVTPLVDYLRRRTEDPSFQIVVLDTYAQVTEALERGEISFGWLPPLTFARVSRAWKSKLLLQSVRADPASHHGALFVREESAVRALPDLRGKRIAWVSPDSCAGYVLAAQSLAQANIEPAAETFEGSDAAVVRAVRSGAADAGATFCAIDLESRPNRIRSAGWTVAPGNDGTRFRALATFGAIPGDVLCAGAETTYAERALFASAMARLHRDPTGPTLLQGLFAAERFDVAEPDQYEPLRQATDELAAVEARRRLGY